MKGSQTDVWNPSVANAPKTRCGTFFIGQSAFSVYEEMARQLRRRGWKQVRLASVERCDLVLGDRFSIPYCTIRCGRLPSDSVFHGIRWINYFQGSHRLTLKASMVRALRLADASVNEWMPLSFVLGGIQEKRADDRRELMLAAQDDDETSVWIIKPSSGAKGKDIQLVRGVDALQAFIVSLAPASRSIFVVQRYIDRPLLLRGDRKFDIRCWVLLKSPYDIFVFSQGSCRTASDPFVMADIGNPFAHLTNHCIQEQSEAFGAHETANEMWFSQLQAYLVEKGEATTILEERVLPQVANIVVRTLLAMKSEFEVLPDEPFLSFQLFGYDVMVESDYHVRLLEINGSPGVADRYLTCLVNGMLEHILCTDKCTSPLPRMWSVEREEFCLLWSPGDPIPEGLH